MDDFFCCENCQTIFVESDLVLAKDLQNRIAIGEPFTPYECPREACGALCHPHSKAVICEIPNCKRMAEERIGYSDKAPNDSFVYVCRECKNLFMQGVLHGRMIFSPGTISEPLPKPPLQRKPGPWLT